MLVPEVGGSLPDPVRFSLPHHFRVTRRHISVSIINGPRCVHGLWHFTVTLTTCRPFRRHQIPSIQTAYLIAADEVCSYSRPLWKAHGILLLLYYEVLLLLLLLLVAYEILILHSCANNHVVALVAQITRCKREKEMEDKFNHVSNHQRTHYYTVCVIQHLSFGSLITLKL